MELVGALMMLNMQLMVLPVELVILLGNFFKFFPKFEREKKKYFFFLVFHIKFILF